MATIEDVSPRRDNTSIGSSFQRTAGRMLSLASAEDGKLLFAGSLSSSLWVSEDGGESWAQIEWPQPPPGQFGVPGAMGGYCATSIAVGPDSARWLVERNPRFVVDITNDGRADIVGFGDTGVWTAIGNGDGTFAPPRVVLAAFSQAAGGWRVDRHPRLLGRLREGGPADIVGFGDDGVWTALGNGDGTFADPRFVLADLGFNSGWRVEKHLRVLADLRGIGRQDIVAFGDHGVFVALSNGDGSFTFTPQPVINDFGFEAGGWRVDRHPRFVADVTGDGFPDIVGFGNEGVWVAVGNGDGTFQPPKFVLADLGFNSGWRVEKHVRLLGDLRGIERQDIVAFGDHGVFVALSNGDGTFTFTPQPVINDLGFEAGGWRVEKHVRLLADVTGEGRADIVAFGDHGVFVALSNGDGTFTFTPQPVINDFGFEAGNWRVEKHPRFLADLIGINRAGIVGFGDAGVYVALPRRDGAFEQPRFVLPNFGCELTVLAILQSDRELEDAGIWRSSDRGRTWALVHSFPRPRGAAVLAGAGQLVWAPGNAHCVYAAGKTSLAVSTDAGATFTNVMALPGGFQPVHHVAVAETPPGALRPPVVYALANSTIFVSFDGGDQWKMDNGPVPAKVGGAVGLANSQNECVMVVSPRSPLEVFVCINANLPPAVFRGDYSQFAATQASTWESLPLPAMGGQDSGNVFLAAPRAGRGNVLFYGAHRPRAFVGPLVPASGDDWLQLDEGNRVHVDLHGIYLSHDFEATFEGGEYRALAGTVWIASDGGISRSTDGGRTFHDTDGVNTLSCVINAAVAVEGKGPVISLNTGDNDGFVSSDGGKSWRSQDYGGGDNDCSFADPLRSHSMLVFTPRWDVNGNPASSGTGQTLALYEGEAGGLPDPADEDMRHVVPGPPLRFKSRLWNATSGFGLRGFRPIVLNMPGDDPAEPGDYVFIRYFGNCSEPRLDDHLAILVRARSIRDIKKREDWDTPGGWRVDRHPRLVGDLTADGRADIVGFGDDGVWTALNKGNGLFADPRFVLADLGFNSGWRVEKHLRVLADLRGIGRQDIVAFGDHGVFVALSNGDGSFTFTPQPVINDFGFEAGGWRVDRHPRFVADVTGDGFPDIVGFGNEGVWVAVGNGDGTFQPPKFVLADLGFNSGWRVEKHVRLLGDLRGIGRQDIVAFGDHGVFVALSNGDGTFTFTPQPVINDLGFEAGGWRVEKHVRLLADVTGEGRADIVAFGDHGVFVALSNGDGTFTFTPQPVINDFGFEAGGWRVEKNPRLLGSVKGNGRADIVGFGNDGTYIAFSRGDGTFDFNPQPVINDFGFDAGQWRVDKHLRFLADLTGNKRADIVGFGDAGVLVSLSKGDGTFSPLALFVIPNFGHGDSGPVAQQGPFLPAADVKVVQASGGHTNTVFYVGGDSASRLWKWTEGMPAWQQLVPGGGGSSARRFFVNPYNPDLIYLLDTDRVMRSDDGGLNWQVDANLQEQLSCGGRIPVSRGEDDDGQGDHLDLVLTDMQFDPRDRGRRFAVGLGGAFMTRDGRTWERLLDTGALRGRPANCCFDWISNPEQPALYVFLAGRSLVRITGL